MYNNYNGAKHVHVSSLIIISPGHTVMHIMYLIVVIYSSNPFNNHTESITGLDVSTSLHLFVSCSYDCSIRTWSQDNNILRYM